MIPCQHCLEQKTKGLKDRPHAYQEVVWRDTMEDGSIVTSYRCTACHWIMSHSTNAAEGAAAWNFMPTVGFTEGQLQKLEPPNQRHLEVERILTEAMQTRRIVRIVLEAGKRLAGIAQSRPTERKWEVMMNTRDGLDAVEFTVADVLSIEVVE